MSKIVLGTVQFGTSYGINNQFGVPTNKEVSAILNFAQSVGILFLDTANEYGDAQKKIKESSLASSFKIYSKFKPSTNCNIKDQFQFTLKELNLNSLWGYSFHNIEEYQLASDTSFLKSTKAQGGIKEIGVSLYDNHEIKQVIQDPLIDFIQIPFNLFDNYKLRSKFISEAKSCGKKVYVRSVFLQGLFFKDVNLLNSKLSKLRAPLLALKKISAENNLSIEELALLYPFYFAEIDKIVIGVETLSQLQSNVTTLQKELKPSVLQEIHNIIIQDDHLLNPRNWQ